MCCASTFARSARFSASRCRCRSALRTTSTVFSSDSGFSTKSKAPILIARTADSTLPWPEMITTCDVDLPLAHARQRGEAVHAGQPDVEHDDVVGLAAEPLEAGLAAVDGVDLVALVAQHAAERAADAGSSSTIRIDGIRQQAIRWRSACLAACCRSTSMLPPCSATMRRTMARPRPLPRCLVE